MKHIECRIVGLSPLMMVRYTEEAALNASKGTRTSSKAKAQKDPKDVAAEQLYTNDKGEIIIPMPNLLSCIMDGGYFHKAGKKQITTRTSSLIPAYVFFDDPWFPLVSRGGWRVHAMPVVNQSTNGRILAYRPVFDDWSVTFDMNLDDEDFSSDFLREIVDTAGKRMGLGGWRPARKGPFGRFRVDEWKVTKLGPDGEPKPKTKIVLKKKEVT